MRVQIVEKKATNSATGDGGPEKGGAKHRLWHCLADRGGRCPHEVGTFYQATSCHIQADSSSPHIH